MAVKKEDGRQVDAAYLWEFCAGRAVLLVEVYGDPMQLRGRLAYSAAENESGKLKRILREKLGGHGYVYSVPDTEWAALNASAVAMMYGAEGELPDRKISFKPLLRLLVDRGMTTADLRRATGITPSTMTEIRASRSVTLDTLVKICNALDCPVEAIVEII